MPTVSRPGPIILSACLLITACTRAASPNPETIAFPHGVASGDVTPSTAVLWTRVSRPAALTVQVAEDGAFHRPVAQRTTSARAGNDLTAQVVVGQLQPATTYYYRWIAGNSTSRTGTFRTAPPPSAAADVRFAYSGDSDGVMIRGTPYYGPFQVLDAVRRDQPHFFVYLGDTVYADSAPRLRLLGREPARTLDQFRALYRENREIDALPDLLAATSIYAIWDDHEVRNDYAGQTIDPQLYATGRRAFLEYMPLRPDPRVRDEQCAGDPLFRAFRWGREVELFIPDLRSCRSELARQACQADEAPTLPPEVRTRIGLPPTPPEGCLEALHAPSRTMLGPVQKALLKAALARSQARYKIVMNEVPIQQFYLLPYDRWEGYPAERTELLSFLRAENIEGVVFLTADTHASIINQVFIDRFTDPEPLAQELVTGPIAATTLEEYVLGLYGHEGLDALRDVLDLVQVDCYNLDTYSYGLVEIDAGTGTMQITLKDRNGQAIRDDRDPTRACVEVIGP